MWPFYHVTLRGQRPLPAAYPKELGTLGDHLRKRRLDLGLRQKDVARQLGANVTTVTNWELGHSGPALWFVPRIIEFLGYVPCDTSPDSLPLPDRIKVYRRLRGLSQKTLARKLGVDPSTLARWECGRSRPQAELLNRTMAVLVTDPEGYRG